MAPIDLISCLVSDELTRRSDRLLERRRKQAGFRDPDRTLDNFDFTFNPKMNRSLVFDLATGAFINKREDALFLGPGGTGKSHLAQAIGQAAIPQGCKVFYRETHTLLDELAEAVADGTRKEYTESVAMVPLLICCRGRKFPNIRKFAEQLYKVGWSIALDFSGSSLLKRYACFMKAEAFVFPSLYEGFGFPPLEAMAFRNSCSFL